MDPAVRTCVPVIEIDDNGGARIKEGVASLGGYTMYFGETCRLRAPSRRS